MDKKILDCLQLIFYYYLSLHTFSVIWCLQRDWFPNVRFHCVGSPCLVQFLWNILKYKRSSQLLFLAKLQVIRLQEFLSLLYFICLNILISWSNFNDLCVYIIAFLTIVFFITNLYKNISQTTPSFDKRINENNF